MNRIYLVPALLAALLFLSACGEEKPIPIHEALVIMNRYQDLSQQANTVEPYRVNLMALDMLGQEKTADDFKFYVIECRNYIQWYLNHVNPIDKYDLSGTIYDYDVDFDGAETSRHSYHSADRTTATFILLLHRFHQITGYTRIFQQNSKKIKDAVYVIAHLQDDADGLIHSLPVTGKKFLAHNCLDYAAVRAYLELAEIFGWEDTDYYRDLEQGLEKAITKHFYRPKRDEFFHTVDGGLKHAPDWRVLTPDSYSQLFPILYQLPPLMKDRRNHRLWRKFTGFHREQVLQLDVVQRLVYRWTKTMMQEEHN